MSTQDQATMPSRLTDRRHAVRGAVNVVPLLTGIAPFGFAVGAAGSASDLSPLAAWSSAVLVYGGSIQLVVLQLIESGAAPAVIALAALIATLPRCLFAITLAEPWGASSWRGRLAVAYLLVEPVFAVSSTELGDTTETGIRRQRATYVGAGITVFVTWLVVTALGALIGGQLPPGTGFELVVPIMMLALAAGTERTPTAWVAAVVAGVLAVGMNGLPFRLGFVAAVIGGLGVGALLDRRVAS